MVERWIWGEYYTYIFNGRHWKTGPSLWNEKIWSASRSACASFVYGIFADNFRLKIIITVVPKRDIPLFGRISKQLFVLFRVWVHYVQRFIVLVTLCAVFGRVHTSAEFRRIRWINGVWTHLYAFQSTFSPRRASARVHDTILASLQGTGSAGPAPFSENSSRKYKTRAVAPPTGMISPPPRCSRVAVARRTASSQRPPPFSSSPESAGPRPAGDYTALYG